MELKKYKLGELLDVKRGASLAGEHYATSGEYIRLTCGNFDYQNNSFKVNTSKDNLYYTGPVREEFIMKKGDIITPLTEQAIGLLGSTAIIPEDGKYIQSQDIAKVICNEELLCPSFAFYLISSDAVKKQLSAAAQQTKIRHTSPDKIKDCTVWIPDLPTQEKTGRILSDIDSKIALNRAINRNLEALAKQLYDYWFVQFDFPNEEGKPYKSSGGQMVWNEKLKHEIPKSWQAVSVNDISESFRGVSYTKDDLVNESQGVLVLRGNNIQDNQLIYDSNVAYIPQSFVSTEQKICKRDIIMTMSSGSKEHVGKCVLFHHNTCETYGAFLTKFSPHPHCSYLLFDVFNSAYFKAKIKSIASGTGINNLTNQTFDNIYIALPPIEILKEFDELQSKIFSEVGVLQQDTWHLIKQRDELLPLLMNGQVSLNSDLSLFILYLYHFDPHKS